MLSGSKKLTPALDCVGHAKFSTKRESERELKLVCEQLSVCMRDRGDCTGSFQEGGELEAGAEADSV